MKEIVVRLQGRSYSILIGRNLLASLGARLKPLGLGRRILIVSNRRVAGLFLAPVRNSLKRAGFEVAAPFLLPQGSERDKSEGVLFRLWSHMACEGLDRRSTVVALGGGVVGDTAGFAAATYMRGINLIQVPTTLLAQVDSSIGGKTGIDLAAAKNMVGAFYQPRLVVCDVSALERMGLVRTGLHELRNSLAEVIKYGVIRDPQLFELLEGQARSFLLSASQKKLGAKEFSFLEKVVSRAAAVKARVVERDERETKGLRMILNYGHTFGHAFEAASGYRLAHGEAVSLGMIAAGRLARRRGIFAEEDESRQRRLIQRIGLPVNLRRFRLNAERVLRHMAHDKKAREGQLRFVLPERIGRVRVFDNVSTSEIKRVLSEAGGR